MKKTKITHLTSVHPRYDTRIFVKECCSLARINSYEINLVVADERSDEIKNNVHIFSVGKIDGRLNRIFKTTKKVLKKAKELDSDIYHFHDPELIPIGLKLKKLGKKVIFDIHEDVPKQILAKPYLNNFSKKILSVLYKIYEELSLKKFDCLITTAPSLSKRFEKHHNIQEIRNYPIENELISNTPWSQRDRKICHIGSLAKTRGVAELIESLSLSRVTLELGGDFRPKKLEDEVRSLAGWNYVDYRGYLSRDMVKEVLCSCKVGIATLHPTDSYLEAIPVKIFEYMAAGIPLIVSDFAFYKDLLKGCDCAVFVNPLNPKEIASATTSLLKDDIRAKQMGENGKEAVLREFNWTTQERKLYRLYDRLT